MQLIFSFCNNSGRNNCVNYSNSLNRQKKSSKIINCWIILPKSREIFFNYSSSLVIKNLLFYRNYLFYIRITSSSYFSRRKARFP
jgi:hypothetical protein